MSNIDLKLSLNSDSIYDISIENGDFALVDSFDTSLIVSLMTDARADQSQVFRSELRRGWWGNQFGVEPDSFQIGSLLWLLFQARNTQNTLNSAIDYAQNSLQWLVDDGNADSVSASGDFTPNGITLSINIFRGNSIVDTKYYDLWQNSGAM